MNQQSFDKQNDSIGFKTATQVLFSILIIAFGIVSALDPMGVLGLPLSIVSAAMILTLTLSFKKENSKVIIVFLLSFVSYIASAWIFRVSSELKTTELLVLALPAFYSLVMALPMYITVRGGMGRSASIAAAAMASMLLFALYTILITKLRYGEVSIDIINQMLDTSFEATKQALASISYQIDGETIRYFNDTDISNMLYLVKTILIGSIAAMMLIICYFTTLAARLIAGCFDVKGLFPNSYRIKLKVTGTPEGPTVLMDRVTVPWRIELSSISAAVMLLAYLTVVLFFSSDRLLPICITAQNLILILLPGFTYCGTREMLSGIKLPSVKGFVFILIGVALFIISPMLLVMLLSTAGATSVIRENRVRMTSESKNKKDNNNKEGM